MRNLIRREPHHHDNYNCIYISDILLYIPRYGFRYRYYVDSEYKKQNNRRGRKSETHYETFSK